MYLYVYVHCKLTSVITSFDVYSVRGGLELLYLFTSYGWIDMAKLPASGALLTRIWNPFTSRAEGKNDM